jgi:hypothetical protein
MTLDLKEHVFQIVNSSAGPLDLRAVVDESSSRLEKAIKAALDELSDEERITKNRGRGESINTWERIPGRRR